MNAVAYGRKTMRKGKTLNECLSGLDAKVRNSGDEALSQASKAGRKTHKRELPSNVVNLAEYRKTR